jgi:D-3-phosphoglycerate dehydrogenase
VLLLEQIHPDADDLLNRAGFEVRSLTRALSEDELIAELPGVSLLGIRSKTNVTARVLEAADSLVAIGAFCIGTNQIDLIAASEHGISVFNAPFSNTRSVVELAIAERVDSPRRTR